MMSEPKRQTANPRATCAVRRGISRAFWLSIRMICAATLIFSTILIFPSAAIQRCLEYSLGQAGLGFCAFDISGSHLAIYAVRLMRTRGICKDGFGFLIPQ